LTDRFKIGRLKLVGSRDLNFYQIEQIKRVKLVRRTDGYYAQFCVDVDHRKDLEPSSHCGTVLDRDHNAALNILAIGLNRVGHT
jgi:hypothetical protein